MVREHSIVRTRLLVCGVSGDTFARVALPVLAWPLAVVIAAFVPVAREAFPALGVARGPVGWIGLAIALAVAAQRVLRGGDAPRRATAGRARTRLRCHARYW